MRSVLFAITLALFSMILWPTPYALAADTRVARGTVKAIGGSTLHVQVRDQEMTFSVDPTTVIVARGGATKSREARAKGESGPTLASVLRVGQNVAVTYNEMNGVLHASNVRTISSTADGAAADAMWAAGTVQAIGSNSITIAGSGGGGSAFTQTFLIDEHTKVFAKGAGTAAAARGGRVPFGEIVTSGDHVSVSYRMAGDRLTASDVRVTMKGTH